MLDRARLLLRLLPVLPRMAAYKPTARLTFADRLEERAERQGHRTWLRFGDRVETYADLNRAANRVAHWGRAAGLECGDTAALLMENRPEYVPTWAGLAKLGVTTALINTNLTGRGLAHALETSGARHLVLGAECADRFATAIGELARPLDVWLLADPDAPAPPEADFAHGDLGGDLATRSHANPDPELRETLRQGDDLFYIYTSGTTGLPKAARFSHLRFLAMGDLGSWIGLRAESVHYCALPLYHSAGGVMQVSSVISAGACLALRRRFSARAFWDDIRRYDATHFQYIGEFCRYLMNQPPRPDDREHGVQEIIGNGLRPDIWQPFQERFGIPHIREFYGATEGNLALMNLEDKVGSVGRFPFRAATNARLIRYDVERDEHPRGPDGLCEECEPGEIGEIVGRIPKRSGQAMGRFEGYTSDEATERKLLRNVLEDGDVYFRSGDLLRQDEDGFYYFVDRIGDTFRWKGENVSTQEVAEILSAFPGLEMVNVYGVQVEGHDGRAGMAALLPSDPASFDAKAFHRFARESLPGYSVPIFVRILAEAEVTGTFKLRKVTLQDEGIDLARIRDPLLLRDDEAGSYVPLDAEAVDEIRSSARRL